MNNSNNAVNVEKHEFNIHPAIIFSLITAQASGVEKALLELVMNSVDAGATRIDISLDQNGFVVADNGQGFADMQAIESCFGVFGLPHEKEDDAFYGRFRLGRAQSFGYAKTEWHTKNYKMFVDLNLAHDSSEYGYRTVEVDEFYQGCKVTGQFYKYLEYCDPEINLDMSISESPYDVQNAVLALALSVKYLPVDVYINGVRVNLHRDTLVPYRVKNNVSYYLTPHLDPKHRNQVTVQVYNKGVYAYSIPSFLLTGDIVSDNAISLNMARNEAQKNCPVAKGISRYFRDLVYEIASMRNGSENDEDDEPLLDNAYYVERFWGKVLGINGEKFSDFLEFKTALKQRWFLLMADETISYHSVFSFYFSLAYSNYSEGDYQRSIYFYSNEQLKKFENLRGDVDAIVPYNGYFPIEVFPSEDILQNLHTLELKFDFSQFEELKPFADLTKKLKITQKFNQSFDLNQRRQALALYMAKVLVWISSAFLYVQLLNGKSDLSSSMVSNRYGVWEIINESSRYGMSDYDREYKTDRFKKYVFERVYESLLGALNKLSVIGVVKPENVKVLTTSYYNTLSSRKLDMKSLDLTPFETEVFDSITNTFRVLDNRINGQWVNTAWRDGYYVKPENINRKLFLADLDDGVLACTDIYDYVLIDYEYFKWCINNNKYELLVYLLMHEVAHCTKKSSDLHGEVFHQGFHILFRGMKLMISRLEDDISSYVLNVNNFKSKQKFVESGISKSNVAYFLKKGLTQYIGRY